jgi:hypothetical protein
MGGPADFEASREGSGDFEKIFRSFSVNSETFDLESSSTSKSFFFFFASGGVDELAAISKERKYSS